jgi:type III restriction enzyme
MRTGKGEVPQHILFPQILAIIKRYILEYVVAEAPADKKDIFISPYYGWVIETLLENLRPDTIQGESPEIPIYEKSRKDGSTFDVDFWTSKPIQEVKKSHLNAIVADTKKWEQQAAYFIDRHSAVDCFVKNAGLGFAIPYIYNGQSHDYEPDFIIRLKTPSGKVHLILETKGFDEKKEYKINAAQRWVQAVNADGTYGNWAYECTDKMTDVPKIIDEVLVKFK